MFYFYTFIYSLKSCFKPEFPSSTKHKHYFEEGGKPNSCWSTVTSIVFFPLLSKSVWTSNCLVTHILQNIFLLMWMYVTLYSILIRRRQNCSWICAVARYYDISSKADRGDIFFYQGRCWPNGCPKQDCIVVPPPSNIMEVLKTTYHRGQNRTLIKYKSK